MGRAIHLVASGEPAWAGAVLKVPRRCMGRLRGFGLTGAALFYGELPTRSFHERQAAELANVLEANSQKPLPPWFIAIVVKSLRGELKKRPGRPKGGSLLEIRFALAKARYPRYLAWLQKRQRVSGLVGWSAVRGKDWWAGPPHQRAARIVRQRWLRHMTWQAVLNRISS